MNINKILAIILVVSGMMVSCSKENVGAATDPQKDQLAQRPVQSTLPSPSVVVGKWSDGSMTVQFKANGTYVMGSKTGTYKTDISTRYYRLVLTGQRGDYTFNVTGNQMELYYYPGGVASLNDNSVVYRYVLTKAGTTPPPPPPPTNPPASGARFDFTGTWRDASADGTGAAACLKDNTYQFNSNGTYAVNPNVKCSSSETTESGTWMLSPDSRDPMKAGYIYLSNRFQGGFNYTVINTNEVRLDFYYEDFTNEIAYTVLLKR